jgi:hypothetical protein
VLNHGIPPEAGFVCACEFAPHILACDKLVTLETPLGIAAFDTFAKFGNRHLGCINHARLALILFLHFCTSPFRENQSPDNQFGVI